MPRYVLRVGAQDYVIATKEGMGKLAELLADAMPVNAYLYKDPPVIELTWVDDPTIMTLLQKVSCQRIPGNVVWKQKSKTGEVVVVRPVEKAPKALKAPGRKALPGPKRMALPRPTPQLALGI